METKFCKRLSLGPPAADKIYLLCMTVPINDENDISKDTVSNQATIPHNLYINTLDKFALDYPIKYSFSFSMRLFLSCGVI